MRPKNNESRSKTQAPKRAFIAEANRDFRQLARIWAKDDKAYDAATHKHGEKLHRKHGAPFKPKQLERIILSIADNAFLYPARLLTQDVRDRGPAIRRSSICSTR